MHFLKNFSKAISFSIFKIFRPSSLHCFRDIRVEKPFAAKRQNESIANVTMEMSYNKKISCGKYDWEGSLLCHINITIAHQNFILLKQEFCHVAFLQHKVETKPGESECLYSQCWYLMEMFDNCITRIALSWNNNVSSAYRIAFAGERERGKKAAPFCTKKRNPFCFKAYYFPKSKIRYRWKFGAAEIWRVWVHGFIVTISQIVFLP